MSAETEPYDPAIDPASIDPAVDRTAVDGGPGRPRGGRRPRPHPLARWAARAGVLMAVATTIAAVLLKVQPPA